MRMHLIGLFLLCLFCFQKQCLAAGQEWYPKATDSCAEFVTKILNSKKQGDHLVTPTKDPKLARYVSDFDAHYTNVSGKGGEALLSLFTYCGNHAFMKLGDITAQQVISDSETKTVIPNSTPQTSQPAPQDALMKCLQDTAASTVAACRQTNCDTSILYDAIGEAQKMRCGYSAIEPIQPPSPSSPNLTSCITSPTPGGGWVTTCM